MLFSRLERLDINLFEDPDFSLSWEHLSQGAEKIRHFLTNQRMISFTDKLTVICLIRTPTFCINPNLVQDSQQIHYELIEEETFIKSLSSVNGKPLHCDALFTWICSQRNFLSDHYSTKKTRQNFIRYYAEKSFKSVSYFVALFLLSIAGYFGVNTIKTNMDIERTQREIATLQQQYATKFGDIEHKLADASLVQSSVAHANLLNLESNETPQKYFSEISKIYSEQRFKSLALHEFYWVKHPRSTIQQIVNQITGQYTTDESYDDEEGYYEENHSNQPILKYQPLLRLSGELNRDRLDYRNTVTVMLDFVSSLENLPIVSDIHLIKTPVDVRPKSKFSDKNGTNRESALKSAEADQYEILIVLKQQLQEQS